MQPDILTMHWGRLTGHCYCEIPTQAVSSIAATMGKALLYTQCPTLSVTLRHQQAPWTSVSSFSMFSVVHVLQFLAYTSSRLKAAPWQVVWTHTDGLLPPVLSGPHPPSKNRVVSRFPPPLRFLAAVYITFSDKSFGTLCYQRWCRKPFLQFHKRGHALRRALSSNLKHLRLFICLKM